MFEDTLPGSYLQYTGDTHPLLMLPMSLRALDIIFLPASGYTHFPDGSKDAAGIQKSVGRDR